jgi:hypothetical protein
MMFIAFIALSFICLGWTQKKLPNAPFGTQLAFSTLFFLLWTCFGGVFLGYLHLLSFWNALIWIGLFIGFSLLHIKNITIAMEHIDKFQISILSIGSLIYSILATPPIWYRDSLTYHLTLPKLWAKHGGYQPTDQILFEYFPSLWQWGLSFLFVFENGDTPIFHPRYIGVFLTMMTTLLICGLIKFMGKNIYYQNIAIVCYLLVPTVIEFGTSVYVMPWLSFLCLTSIYIHTVTTATKTKTSMFLWILEIVIGAAIISSKYSGLIWIFCLMCLKAHQSKDKQKVLRYGFFVAIAGSFFYIRNYLLHQNPVFPKFASFFGAGYWGEWRSWGYEITLQDYGYGREFIDYLLLPFRLFSTLDLQNGFQGSLGVSIGILFIICLYYDRHIRYLIIPWFLLWAIQVQQIRFFTPIVGVIVAYGITKIPRKRLWMIAALSLTWSLSPIKELWQRQQGLKYWMETTSDQDFLQRQLPENYPIDQFVNSLETKDKIWYIWMRGYTYYSTKNLRVDSVFGAWRFEEILDGANTTQEFMLYMKKENMSHIVINHRFFLVDNNADLEEGRTKKLQQKFDQLIEQKDLQPIHQIKNIVVYHINIQE